MSPEPVRTDPSASLTAATPSTDQTTRRGLLYGAGLAGLAAGLAGCGGSDDKPNGTYGQGSPSGAQSSEQKPQQDSDALAQTSDIPVGGGKVFKGEKVVVTQPKKGEFVAFSATCTHRGCTVGEVAGGTINCPCHGSKYKISDASVVSGPAPKPLPPKKIKVEGTNIRLA